MTVAKRKIKTSTIVLVIVVYTFLNGLLDFKNGLVKGWNSVKYEKVK